MCLLTVIREILSNLIWGGVCGRAGAREHPCVCVPVAAGTLRISPLLVTVCGSLSSPSRLFLCCTQPALVFSSPSPAVIHIPLFSLTRSFTSEHFHFLSLSHTNISLYHLFMSAPPHPLALCVSDTTGTTVTFALIVSTGCPLLWTL